MMDSCSSSPHHLHANHLGCIAQKPPTSAATTHAEHLSEKHITQMYSEPIGALQLVICFWHRLQTRHRTLLGLILCSALLGVGGGHHRQGKEAVIRRKQSQLENGGGGKYSCPPPYFAMLSPRASCKPPHASGVDKQGHPVRF